tara:strand:+ start:580 stop:1794 length:1215 start_codon:yes stop_codon:yes gene_type:complete
MSSGKRKAREAPVTNNNTTINNYFTPKEGPADAPSAPTGPTNLFPNDERRNYKYLPYCGRTRPVLVSQASPDGILKGGCYNCTKVTHAPIERFAPTECNNNGRNRPDFFEALSDYDAAYAARDLDKARDARRRIEELRNGRCPSCQEALNKLSPNQQACKDEYERMRKAACERNNGCCNQNCVERGPEAWCVLEGDHVHTRTETDEALRKVQALGDYKWWSGNGGVAAMRAEEAKGVEWKCRFCHSLEKTGFQANKYENPETMSDGKRSGTKEEIALYKRKLSAKMKYPKQQYVDHVKREVRKGCAKCHRPVLEGQEHAFDFDHRDPSTKIKGSDTLAGVIGGVSGLVNNYATAAALDEIQDILDEEMEKCDLLCRNCHHRKTWGYPFRGAAGSSSSDAGSSRG